jgi:two-component system nitrate/nitrite response regulator NarL
VAPIGILLANRQSLFREAVCVALSDRHDIEVICEARDGVEAVEKAERYRADIALIDAGLERGGCAYVVGTITENVPSCQVIVLGDSEDSATLIEAVQSGASGYITKDAALVSLTEAILRVHEGDMLVPSRMLGPLLKQLVQHHRERDEALRAVARLTSREREILFLLTRGADNHAIADRLVISPHTARTHIQHVLAKLEVHSRLEATAFVIRNGIVDYLSDIEVQLPAGAPRSLTSVSI